MLAAAANRTERSVAKEEADEAYACFDTEDFRIGFQSFLDKTKPVFTGR